ncbi:MAG: hypothetical protein IJV85_02625 [Clostridia bacterium]|nr:hypothetical protein [Clostridia bacterium]
MKKILSLLLCCIMMLSIVSCSVKEKNIYLSSDDTSLVECIELYSLDKQYTNADVANLREENEAFVIISDKQVISNFIKDLSSLIFGQEVLYFPLPVDWVYLYERYVVSIVYSNGYDIIAKNSQFYYSVDDKGNKRYKQDHSDYIGDIPWNEIITKYIDP